MADDPGRRLTELLSAVDDAVSHRFRAICNQFRERDDVYSYTGRRTRPKELGWRFRQTLSIRLGQSGGLCWPCYPELPAEILAGKHDRLIEHAWHDAASAEHYYRHQKDYGCDEPEPEYLDEDSYDDESEEDHDE